MREQDTATGRLIAPLPLAWNTVVIPSIFTPGQFLRKKVASAQDVICEQRVRPSHLNRLLASGWRCGVDEGFGRTRLPMP